jgi:hypothetical protein
MWGVNMPILKPMPRSVLAISAAAAFAFPALATERSFAIPTPAVVVGGIGAGNAAIELPDGTTTTLFFNFVLPRDYAQNQPVRIVLYLSSSAAPCTVRLVPEQLLRFRLGAPVVKNASGLSVRSPTVNLDNNLRAQILTLAPGTVLSGQRVGDAFTVSVQRQATDPSDTCAGSVFVEAVDVRYPRRRKGSRMKPTRDPWPAIVVLVLLPLFVGCVPTVEDAKAQAVAKARVHCAAEGKQFVLLEASGQKFDDVFVMGASATIAGHCVGPGDPGYVPPPQ